MRLANKLRQRPQHLAARCLRKQTETTAGDSDPSLAVEDALCEFTADEVVVVTRPNEEASWLEEGKGREIAASLHGVKVTRLELSD
jgi:hypothetical protein